MRLCSYGDELYIWFSFYILFLSNSCMFSVAFYCFGQLVDSNSKKERLCLIVGSCPPMSSLSDRNMRLGDVMLPLGRKNDACNCGCKDCLPYAKFVNAVVCCFGFTLWVGLAT